MSGLLSFGLLWLSLLVPNFLRHLAYLVVYHRTGELGHVVSFETRVIYSSGGFPWKGLFEEVVISLFITFFWFNFPLLGFLAFGWLVDALLDVAYSFVFLETGRTPLQFLFSDLRTRFVVRELVIPYVLVGPVLFLMGFQLFHLVVAVSVVNAGLCCLILWYKKSVNHSLK